MRARCWLLASFTFLLAGPAWGASTFHGEIQGLAGFHKSEGVRASARITEYELRLTYGHPRGIRGFTDLNLEEGETHVEEAYLTVRTLGGNADFGKFLLPFGIYRRQDLVYVGFVDIPLLKSESIRGFQLAREGTGVRLSGGTPALSYEAAVMNGNSGGLNRITHGPADVVVRLQGFRNPVIVGLNGYNGHSASETAAASRLTVRVGGVDWRLSVPFLILRGEFVRGRVEGREFRGYYVDAFHHVPSIPNLTALLRVESFNPLANAPSDRTRQITLGAKYFFRPYWTLALNGFTSHAHGRTLSVKGEALYIHPF